MSLATLLFGRRPDDGLKVVKSPPAGALLRCARAREGGETVRAERAVRDGVIETKAGKLRYEAARDYVLEYPDGARAVVRADIFERTYSSLGDGRFEKRADLQLRYFTLPKPVMVRTLEGFQRANAGDWIMQGVAGELWPVSPEQAQRKYEDCGTAH